MNIEEYEKKLGKHDEKILVIGEEKESTPFLKITNIYDAIIPKDYFDKIIDSAHYSYTFFLIYKITKKESRYIISNPSPDYCYKFIISLLFLLKKSYIKNYISSKRNYDEDFNCIMKVFGCLVNKIVDEDNITKIVITISKPHEYLKKYFDKKTKKLYSYLTSIRQNVFNKFAEILHDLIASIRLEDAIYSLFKDEDNIKYRQKSRDLIANLRDNEILRNNVLQGITSIEQLINMTIEELAKEELKKEREEQKKEIMGAIFEETCVPNTSLYKCGKCKSKRIHIEQKQTRGADEGSTNFITCCDCGNRWKEYN